ncbi:RWD domain-containing protein 3-like isoform X2 [Homarus americanus]|uniref:RWD domain-containing protein 3-like isoform X2 n=1 Tax=Homarus americanus TaxID=6706 RepID=UPI001C45E38E|nr:RWD domain-containing protein 3-like isoform X2 [Homarus americanus]
MEGIYEEIEAIEAIYCGKDEFCLHYKGASSVEFSVTTSPVSSHDLKITLVFILSSPLYPSEPPSVSVQCSSLTRAECDSVKIFLMEVAKSCCGSSMVLDLLTALQEKEDIGGKHQDAAMMKNDTSNEPVTCILQLDHMRSKAKYLKTIKAWCEELDLVGRIVFCLRWIFLFLQGSADDIKMYIQRNKTQCVDVNSSGKPCKERLLSVLYQGV